MTCIVAVSDGEKVVMGGDSAGISGWEITCRADPKVFKNGPLLIGFTSSFRMGQLLEFNLEVPELPIGADLYQWMVKEFIPAARKTLKEGGYAKVESNTESGGAFLVGIDDTIFEVGCDFQVGMPSDGYAAVGCGESLALGSLYSCADHFSAREAVQLALEAAEYHSGGVAGPFNILETDPSE